MSHTGHVSIHPLLNDRPLYGIMEANSVLVQVHIMLTVLTCQCESCSVPFVMWSQYPFLMASIDFSLIGYHDESSVGLFFTTVTNLKPPHLH